MSKSNLFMKAGEKLGLCLREMKTCIVLASLNFTRLSLPHFSTFAKSSVRGGGGVDRKIIIGIRMNTCSGGS